MTIEDLQALGRARLHNEPDLFKNPHYLTDYLIEALQPDLTPLHPDWTATVFYDPERFPNEVSRERILRHYAGELPDRRARLKALDPKDLSRTVFSKYPRFEEIFRRRGFVADVDLTTFEKKDHHAMTRYLARHRAAVCLQLALIDHLLIRRAASPNGTMKRKKQLNALCGGSKRFPLSLVERDGVFLPARELRPFEAIHLALMWEPDLALEHGHRDPDSLIAAMPDELMQQIRFERRHSHGLIGARPAALLLWQTQALAALRKTASQVELLNGTAMNAKQHEQGNSRRRALEAIDAVSKKLQSRCERARSDALRADRRTLNEWRACGERDNPAVLRVLGEAMEEHRRAGVAACDRALDEFEDEIAQIAVPDRAFTALTDGLTTDELDRSGKIKVSRRGDFYQSKQANTECLCGISTELNLVAALHGATYCRRVDFEDPYDREDPIAWLQSLAFWIGELKRQRVATLTRSVAASLLAVLSEIAEPDLDDPDLGRYAHLIFDRFDNAVWHVLGAACRELLKQKDELPTIVVYNWTRDPNRPWHAERRADPKLKWQAKKKRRTANDTVVITGPLLDFPRSCASFWNEKTRLIKEEKGLVFGCEK